MSKHFQHTVQPLGSTTSPVEDLALEVEKAFTELESLVEADNALLGMPFFPDLEKHSAIQTFSETHNMLADESEIVLKHIPESIAVSYFDSNYNSNSTVQLTKVSSAFTDINQFKVVGKVLVLNIRGEVPVTVDYTARTFALGDKALAPNIVNKTFDLTPSLQGGKWVLEYDKAVELPGATPLVFFAKEDQSYFKLPVTSYAINDKKITLETTEALDNYKVTAFSYNTSVSALLNALYKEFREHSHSSLDSSLNVDARHLVNRYVNSDKISYKATAPNYLFPQYFNREGHNPSLDDIYENAILGNLFLSRTIATSQKFKGLDADSNALIFADPVRGHRLKYSRQDESLVLDSVAAMHGLRINTEEDKIGLKLNESTLASTSEGLKIAPQGNVLDVRSPTAIKYTIKGDKIESESASIASISTPLIDISGTLIRARADGAEIAGKPLLISSPLMIENFKFGEGVVYKAVTDGVLVEGTGKARYNVPLEAHTLLPDTLKFGNIWFKKNAEDNLEIAGAAGAVALFKAKATFEGGLDGVIQMGGVSIQQEGDNMTIESASNSLLVKSEAVFDNFVGKSDSKINIAKATILENINGKVSQKVEEDELHFIQTAPSGKVVFKAPTVLENATYKRLSGERLQAQELVVGDASLSSGSDAKLQANKLYVAALEADRAEFNAFKLGDVVSAKDDIHHVVSSTNASAKMKVNVPTEHSSLLAANLEASEAVLTSATADKLKLGEIAFQKKDKDAEVVREGTEGILKIKAPVEADNFIAVNFGTSNDATMKNIYATNIIVNGVRWTSDAAGHSVITGSRFKFSLPVEMQETRIENASSVSYKLLVDDKILIDDFNYITNHNGRFSSKLTHGFTFVGSGRGTGTKYALEHDSSPAINMYISSNAGTAAVESEKNAFIEVNTNDGIYFLQPTNKKVQHKGSIYGFNDPTAQTNVSDLRRWLRAPLYAGNVEFNKAMLALADETGRNGLSIGDTRISVIGAGTECPIGLTTFESLSGIHFVAPLGDSIKGCKNLTYQEVNVGPLGVKGDATIEASLAITDDLMVGGTASAAHLDVTSLASVSKLTVSSDLSVLPPASFKNTVDVANNLTVAGNIEVKGGVETKSLRTTQSVEVGKDLHVGKDLFVESAVIEKSLVVRSGLIKSSFVEVEGVKANAGEILTDFKVGGAGTIAGTLSVGASTSVSGNIKTDGNLEVKESITGANIYAIKDVTVREKLDVFGVTSLTGNIINIGKDSSKISLNGRLSINTEDLSVNSPTKIYNTLKVSERAEFSGEVVAKAGMQTEAGISAKGVIRSEASVEAGNSISAKLGEISQDLRVGSSITADNITSDSIVIQERGAIANLTVSGSLTMPVDTSIVVGNIKANSYVQVDSGVTNSFAGGVFVAKQLEVGDNVKVNGAITLDSGELQISSLGIKGKDAILDVNKVKAEAFVGTLRIQPPPNLATTENSSAKIVSSLIASSNDYLKLNNALFEGISVFSQPVVAGTIYYTDLINIKERDGSGQTASVDIIARRALYA